LLEDINFPLVSSAEIRVLENVGHIILDEGNTVAEFALENQPDRPAD
jgi:hypothetical protein